MVPSCIARIGVRPAHKLIAHIELNELFVCILYPPEFYLNCQLISSERYLLQNGPADLYCLECVYRAISESLGGHSAFDKIVLVLFALPSG